MEKKQDSDQWIQLVTVEFYPDERRSRCNCSRVAKIFYPESMPFLSHILQLLSSGEHKTAASKTPGKITTINVRLLTTGSI